jgi:hypothetical protein
MSSKKYILAINLMICLYNIKMESYWVNLGWHAKNHKGNLKKKQSEKLNP